MSNTILITGSAVSTGINDPVKYEINIWGQHGGNPIQLVTVKKLTLKGYDWLWPEVKPIVADYFKDDKFLDGGYTTYLEHLITHYE